MNSQHRRTGFHTNMYAGALKINEEMKKGGKVKKDTFISKDGTFYTDAFAEALKINEEMHKRHAGGKTGNDKGLKDE